MKRKNKAVGPLRYLVSFITENWWLKLLALALAIIIYQSLKSEKQKDTSRNSWQSNVSNNERPER